MPNVKQWPKSNTYLYLLFSLMVMTNDPMLLGM